MNDFAKTLRSNQTEAELRLWARLRRRQLNGFKFRRQRPIGSYVCDFVCLEAGLIVELDGSQHIDDAAYDSRRDDFLRAEGFRVLRFWNGYVFSEIEGVLATIYEATQNHRIDGRLE